MIAKKVKLTYILFLIISLQFSYGQIIDSLISKNHCESAAQEKMGERMSDLSRISNRDGLGKILTRKIHKEYDSIELLMFTSWYCDFVFYRDTSFFMAFNDMVKNAGLDRDYNSPNLLYTPPQLSQSRIASLPAYDSMAFYYFTWYTIKGDWEAATWRGYHRSRCYIKEQDAEKNGDLPDGLWRWYDSMDYTRVYMLRKLVLQRTPCKWIITAYKDKFYTPDALHPAIDSFNLMMKDGKERFKFEYENTYAQCMTADDLIEWNYPLDYNGKSRRSFMTGQYYLQNTIWEYAKIELKDKQAKKFKLKGMWHQGWNRNELTNNFIVKFNDGSHKSYYLPYYFYIPKYYIRQWRPGE